MKYRLLVYALALVAAPVVADEKKADFDVAKLEGKWKLTAGEKFGEKVEGKALEGVVTITKDTITIKSEVTHVMKYTLDTKASPVAITMTGEEGPAKGYTALGIIEIKGDELRLCYGMPDEKRPTKFASNKDDKTLFFTLKRP